MIGRVLRTSPGKTGALLIDLRGAVHVHGLPDEHREFTLDGDAITGGAAPVKVCPACAHVCPISLTVCPACGRVFTSERDEDRADLVKISRKGQKERERSYFIEQLEAARVRGFKPGFAAHRFVDEFGRFPRALWRELVPKAAAAA